MTELEGLNFLAGLIHEIFGNVLLVIFILPTALMFLAYLVYIAVMTIRELRKK